MTALQIPRSLPSHTRTWLAFLDAQIAERARDRHITCEAEARWQLSRATGNTAYFLALYLETMEGKKK